jgi:Fe2+ transport system protein FeoA
MSDVISLVQMQDGERGVLWEIPGEHPLAARLRDMGWFIGGEITRLYAAPSGDPIAYSCGSVSVALRARDAAQIMIKREVRGNRGYEAKNEREA